MSENLLIDVQHVVSSSFTLAARLELGPGITALRGASGAGKTTLLKLIAGVLKPSHGSISLGTEIWAGSKWLPPERRGISMMFQAVALFPHLTVMQNVSYGGPAGEWLEKCRVSHLADRRPGSLSGGEAQRVALARALARKPRVFLLDEPFASLDDTLRTTLREELRALLPQLGVPVLLVTHDDRDATLASRVVALSSGSIAVN